MNERPELSFDGHGINGPDEYRTRIAAFITLAGAERYGPLFAAAPELLDLVKDFDLYLRQIRGKHLDGSEQALGELLDKSRSILLAARPQ